VIKRPSVDEEIAMSNHVYRVVEVVGSSPEGVDDAIRNAVARAARTTRNLDWFEVTQIRGQLDAGAVAHVQVGLKIGFRLDDE
jgi:flavin-binding protein dodecin